MLATHPTTPHEEGLAIWDGALQGSQGQMFSLLGGKFALGAREQSVSSPLSPLGVRTRSVSLPLTSSGVRAQSVQSAAATLGCARAVSLVFRCLPWTCARSQLSSPLMLSGVCAQSVQFAASSLGGAHAQSV